MNSQLLDIQPQELKFIFEVKKQSSCSVRLTNNSHNHVAFKVKTTSPKKYCVRPNVGIIRPNSSSDFTVTMQGQQVAPPDMICKDKFLIQSTVVSAGTTDKDITASMFAKDSGKYIEENKVRVTLVSPTQSPVYQKWQPGSDYEASIKKVHVLSTVQLLTQQHKVAEEVNESNLINDKGVKIFHEVGSKPRKDAELKPAENVELKKVKDAEEVKLVKDIKEMKSKLNKLESKLGEAEVSISNLTEERRKSIQESKILQEELAGLRRSGREVRRVQVGFPFLFVCVVAFSSAVFGHLLRL